MSWLCLIRHRWTAWSVYRMRRIVPVRGFAPGSTLQVDLHRRECLRCGQQQTRGL